MFSDPKEKHFAAETHQPPKPSGTVSCMLSCFSGSQKPALERDGVERSRPQTVRGRGGGSTGWGIVSGGLIRRATGLGRLCFAWAKGLIEGPEDFLVTLHGSCFLTAFHCLLRPFYVLNFSERGIEMWGWSQRVLKTWDDSENQSENEENSAGCTESLWERNRRGFPF